MRDYDTLFEKRWLPYLMYFQPAGRVTRSFTTDSHGFRRTAWREKDCSFESFCASGAPRAALVGGSAAFGVGATSDEYTLASCLNRSDRQRWFNFSGRAYNSTQEWLVFLLHLPPSVKTVLIFSGANNLALARLSDQVSPIYNALYAQNLLERLAENGSRSGARGALAALRRVFARGLAAGERTSVPANGSGQTPDEKYQNILTCYQRDLRIWATLRQAMGFQLYFVFQPIASWIPKSLVPEEQRLFELLDAAQVRWATLTEFLKERSGEYVGAIRRICGSLEIPFLDLNAALAFRQPRWLFVDRAHLTDEGYRLAAVEIEKAFGL